MESATMLWQQGWIWAVAGLVLGVLEILIPGNILIGFAIGAMVVAILLWTGLGAGLTFALLLAVMAISALVAFIVLRRVIGIRAGQVKIVERDINDNK
jgi:inner membrane protein